MKKHNTSHNSDTQRGKRHKDIEKNKDNKTNDVPKPTAVTKTRTKLKQMYIKIELSHTPPKKVITTNPKRRITQDKTTKGD